jgi:hypothetical protein
VKPWGGLNVACGVNDWGDFEALYTCGESVTGVTAVVLFQEVFGTLVRISGTSEQMSVAWRRDVEHVEYGIPYVIERERTFNSNLTEKMADVFLSYVISRLNCRNNDS